MPDPTTNPPTTERWTILVRGVVQGVGFRPLVYNAARALGLGGWVQNEADMVRIEVCGPAATLETFVERLRRRHPPAARIDKLDIVRSPAATDGKVRFEIRASAGQGPPRPTIPADLATCAACREEISTPGERRHLYPFTNCTNCGPRWSIIVELPYDRPRTAMAGFPMCPACEAEYHDPSDRRFHAQPIACPACGPRLELLDADGKRMAIGNDALEEAAAAVLAGRILAMKGLGGFQLVVDATRPDAVAGLRNRKRRPDKPLAVMLASIEEIQARCEVSDDEAGLLASPQAPIVLLRRQRWAEMPPDDRATGAACHCLPAAGMPLPAPGSSTAVGKQCHTAGIADEVAPGNPYLGVMLPYTPLHQLLVARIGRAIVCTSGNLSEEPMAVTTDDALARLGSIADVFLVHDRPIVRPVDDSVVRVADDGPQVLRRARGYAPLPIELRDAGPTVLAVGGHLKNTVALALGRQVVVSQHVGDLDNLASVEVHQRTIRDLLDFFRVTPEVVACDLHPDYASTRTAEALASQWGIPLVRVQHHVAHVAACMAEHRLTGPALGLAWDGTGYGPDGSVWGGEALEYPCRMGLRPVLEAPNRSDKWETSKKKDGSETHPTEFRRIAHLRTFALLGGDRAVREPRRSAQGLLFEIFGDAAAEIAAGWFAPEELRGIMRLLARPRLSPRTSSMGRLFDAVAALCGLATVVSFEGQAAMALEFAADENTDEAYSFIVSETEPAVIDWEPALRAILADRAAGVPPGRISARFHNALAHAAVAVARRWGGSDVVLSGGCFQNLALSQRVGERLRNAGFRVYTHRLVPPNDGGIALGQAVIAAGRPAPISQRQDKE